MSLGSRTFHRSSILAKTHTVAIPREPLLFLYPHHFTSSAIQAPLAVPEARAHNLDDFSILSKQVTHIDQAIPTLSDDVPPKSATCTARTQIDGLQAEKTSSGPLKLEQELNDRSKRFEREVLSTNSLSDANEVPPQALKDALASLTKESLQDWFKSRHVATGRTSAREVRQKLVHAQAELKSRLHDQEPWPFDWSIPLQELEKHFPLQEDDSKGGAVFSATTAFDQVAFKINIKEQIRMKRRKLIQIRAQDIPRPVSWSCPNLTDYVTELTQSEVTRHMNRLLYEDGKDHARAVARILKDIFLDGSSQPFLTFEAFNMAINFFVRHEMFHSVRNFYTLMENLGMDTDPETINIMLRSAASRKDLDNFNFLFGAMIRKRIKPTEDTWVALLTAVVSDAARVRIVNSMRERGILKHKSILKSVANEVVPLGITNHVNGGQDIASFFREVDSMYGPRWLSGSACNKMCQILGEQNLMPEAIEVLDIMVARGCHPTAITLNIFLGHCKRQRDLEGAIYLLHWFHTIWPSISKHHDTSTYDILFSLAWESLHFNCCRVIWCTACIEAAVSYRMRELVLKSLLQNTPEVPQYASQLWMKSAGKFIVGIDRRINGDSERVSAGNTVFSKLTNWAETGPQRAASRKLASLVLARDFEASKNYSHRGSFMKRLAAAFELDKTWRTDGAWWSNSLLWKIQNAVDIDTQEKTDKPAKVA